MQFDDKTAQNVHQQIQSCTLELIENIGIENLKITIIDLDIRANFPDLAKLNQSNDKVTVIRESKDAINVIQNLVNHAREIDQKLGSEFQTLQQYNLKSTKKEPFQILLIANLTNNLVAELPNLQALIKQSQRFGIYFLGSLDIAFMMSCEARIRQTILSILKQMPFGFPTAMGYVFQNIPDIIAKTIDSFGFEWELMPSAKMDSAISQINKKKELLNKEEIKNNFLSIEIGKVNNQSFFFEMGNSSGSVHAIIAGRTRYGKTTLLKQISEGFENYPKDEIAFYLVDLKGGADFIPYKKHKNLIKYFDDSNGLDGIKEILNDLFAESKRRKAMLIKAATEKQIAINDIDEYQELIENCEKLPHIILIIDETHLAIANSQINAKINEIATGFRFIGIHLLLCFNSTHGKGSLNDLMTNVGLKIAFNLGTSATSYGFDETTDDKFRKLKPFTCLYKDANNEVILELNKSKN
ncbi:MAG: FtsK/SpoIIIE domain-containing protein [Spirosomataceae bacterium]